MRYYFGFVFQECAAAIRRQNRLELDVLVEKTGSGHARTQGWAKETSGGSMRGMMMMVGLPWAGMMQWALSHGVCAVSVGVLSGIAWRSCKREKGLLVEIVRERRMREELEAYAKLDGSVGLAGSAKKTAKLVCRTVVQKSVFRRAAMLVCDAEGKLYVAGSAGMDDLAVTALGEWGEEAVLRDRVWLRVGRRGKR